MTVPGGTDPQDPGAPARSAAAPGPDPRDPRVAAVIRRSWRRNLVLMAWLLAVWAVAGLGCGVLWADALDAVSLGGFPLGFWFAQQGSILVFVVLVLVYALVMRRLDARHHAELAALADAAPPPGGDADETAAGDRR